MDGNKLQAEWRPARGGRTGPRPPVEEKDGMMQRRDLDFSSRDMMLQVRPDLPLVIYLYDIL